MPETRRAGPGETALCIHHKTPYPEYSRASNIPNTFTFSADRMATLGLSKVFILDKYFTELQKFWETEKKLQGKTKLACCSIYTISSISINIKRSKVN